MLWRDGSQDTLERTLPNRSWSAISNHAQHLGLKRQKTPSSAKSRRRWTPEEDAQTKELYETGASLPDMVTSLCRSRAAIIERAAAKGWQRPASARWQKLPVVWKSTDHNFKVSKEESSPVIQQTRRDVIPAAELGRAAFTGQQLFYHLTLEFLTEGPLVSHGKVLSPFPIILRDFAKPS